MPSRHAAFLVLLAALAGAAPAQAADAVFRLEDPRGDDYGDGTLVYPLNPDFKPGTLDLVAFSAAPDQGGTTFSATFASRIVEPDVRALDSLGKSLKDTAKLGFFTFNIDVYIDTDRVPGSGRTDTVPGRKVTIDPATAWERAIVLTPQPGLARGLLEQYWARVARAEVRENKGRVENEDVRVAEEYVRHEAADLFHFAEAVSVKNRTVSFTVPAQFLGGVAKPEWAYTVVVTAATLDTRIDIQFMTGSGALPERVFNLPVASGKSAERLGGGRIEDALQPPIVDVIVPAGSKQEDVLRDYDLRQNRAVKLTGVVPAPPSQ